MFVVQETGVSRFQASGGKREVSGERETHATGKGAQKIITRPERFMLYARFALAFARLKNAKKNAKKKQLLFCKLQEQRNKTGVPSLQGNSIGFEFLFYAHCTVFGFTVHVCLFLSLHCHVTKSDNCLIKILRYKTEFC